MDIGTFSKCALLTGAGWSHNWGARLAAGVWQLIMDNPEVAANDRLRTLLLDEPSFEVALAKSQVAPFTTDDREQFKRALVDAFVSMDRAMTRPFDGSPGTINIYKVQELLFRFAGQRGQGVDTGYYFTLNQDLFPERTALQPLCVRSTRSITTRCSADTGTRFVHYKYWFLFGAVYHASCRRTGRIGTIARAIQRHQAPWII
jgi:hypothetical protein